ncbi:MAG: hypothetical protein H6P96_183 [Candidatus Aminicenantes bacterium]|nr:hypothetical protein [Candidatus Aminicenantes bacterium]
MEGEKPGDPKKSAPPRVGWGESRGKACSEFARQKPTPTRTMIDRFFIASPSIGSLKMFARP